MLQTTEGFYSSCANQIESVTDENVTIHHYTYEVHTLDSDACTVTGFTLEKLDIPISVYNLEIADFNSYFVGDGVLVHNKCGDARHHSYPKYLGGDAGQDLTPIPREVHDRIHVLIDKVFPRTAPKGTYIKLIDDPFFKMKVYYTLENIYKLYEDDFPFFTARFLQTVLVTIVYEEIVLMPIAGQH